ncbi:hypothetical protein BH11PSE9_BH11PSE9_18240 [soil metagenome]
MVAARHERQTMPRIRFASFASLVSTSALAALAGCASQPFAVVPDTSQLERAPDAPPKSKATVGYFIPNAYRQSEIKAIGDAGSYFPYRDMEAGYRQVLGNLFEGVFRLEAFNDAEAIRAAGVQYIVVPELATSSVSSHTLTGSSSVFSVELTSNVRCPGGALIANPQVIAQSTGEMQESLLDKGAAGRRAMGEALAKAQKALAAVKLEADGAGSLCGARPHR